MTDSADIEQEDIFVPIEQFGVARGRTIDILLREHQPADTNIPDTFLRGQPPLVAQDRIRTRQALRQHSRRKDDYVSSRPWFHEYS